VSQRQKQRTNENRARRLGTGEGISRHGRKGGGGGGAVPAWAWVVGGAILVAAIAVVVALVVTRGGSSPSSSRGGQTPSVITQRNSTATFDPVSQGSWPPNYDNLAAAITALGLPTAGVATHYHVHITLYVTSNGKSYRVPIPQNIGIDQATQTESPIHTHDDKGIIHIESSKAKFTAPLQDVFDIWGVRFDSRCVGGYCGGVEMWVNGTPNTQYGSYVLREHDVITIVEGKQPANFKPDTSFPWAKNGL
jgi:hypothetical protein